jgi:hypothetical protein
MGGEAQGTGQLVAAGKRGRPAPAAGCADQGTPPSACISAPHSSRARPPPKGSTACSPPTRREDFSVVPGQRRAKEEGLPGRGGAVLVEQVHAGAVVEPVGGIEGDAAAAPRTHRRVVQRVVQAQVKQGGRSHCRGAGGRRGGCVLAALAADNPAWPAGCSAAGQHAAAGQRGDSMRLTRGQGQGGHPPCTSSPSLASERGEPGAGCCPHSRPWRRHAASAQCVRHASNAARSRARLGVSGCAGSSSPSSEAAPGDAAAGAAAVEGLAMRRHHPPCRRGVSAASLALPSRGEGAISSSGSTPGAAQGCSLPAVLPSGTASQPTVASSSPEVVRRRGAGECDGGATAASTPSVPLLLRSASESRARSPSSMPRLLARLSTEGEGWAEAGELVAAAVTRGAGAGLPGVPPPPDRRQIRKREKRLSPARRLATRPPDTRGAPPAAVAWAGPSASPLRGVDGGGCGSSCAPVAREDEATAAGDAATATSPPRPRLAGSGVEAAEPGPACPSPASS